MQSFRNAGLLAEILNSWVKLKRRCDALQSAARVT
jgi:hypothetical protein